MPKTVLQPASLRTPSPPYVPGTKRGPFVFTAGQVGVDKNGKLAGGKTRLGFLSGSVLGVAQTLSSPHQPESTEP